MRKLMALYWNLVRIRIEELPVRGNLETHSRIQHTIALYIIASQLGAVVEVLTAFKRGFLGPVPWVEGDAGPGPCVK